jgi:predicted cupin superfamily sugar epimerase
VIVPQDLTAAGVIALLGLEPQPEGGHFRETFRDPDPAGGRAHSTAIYYLLAAGEHSDWHRVRDAAEVWHFYAGGPLLLRLAETLGAEQRIILGPNLAAGERPQAIVPRDWWQAAESLGAWTLIGCTVAPGFAFASFELAPKGT